MDWPATARRLPVDVIVPAYNAAAYLPESLASIAAQTCAVERVIVVDDGSTDETASIARAFGCTVLRGPNRGVAEARNLGMRASQARYIAFLDADDRWHPQRLETQLALRDRAPDVLLFSTDARRWTDGVFGEALLGTFANFAGVARQAIAPGGYVVRRDDMVRALAIRNFTLPSTFLLDRRLIDEHRIFFAPRRELPESDAVFIGEDYEWLLRALRYTDIAFVDRVLVDYRVLASSLSARRGRIRYGDVALGRLIERSPHAYALGAPEAFAAVRVRAVVDSAVAHMRAGEVDLMCARLRELATIAAPSQRVGFGLAYAALAVPGMRRIFRPLGMLPRPPFIPGR